MFSSRFHWDLRPNRLTQILETRRLAGAQILDLTESNPTKASFEYPPEIITSFSDTRMLRYQPAPSGLPEAREAVTAYYADRGSKVDIGRVLLTASTSEAYSYLFKLLCNPGDQVVVPRPSYPLFEFLANLESVEVRHYPLVYHGGWGIDLDALESVISERTCAIVVVNPNNPTGSYLKRHELEAMVRLATARGIAVISDEVFSDYSLMVDPERVVTLAEVEDCLAFSMSGLSKIAGLPQMKLGWIIASGPAALRAEALEKLEWIADTYLSVSTPVQYAAPGLLEAGALVQKQIRERTTYNLSVARNILALSAANILQVEGGWYITVQVPRTRSEEDWVLGLLTAEGVLVQPGFFFDFQTEAYLVVSLLTEPDAFSAGISRLRRYVESPDR